MSGHDDILNCTRVSDDAVHCDGKTYKLEEFIHAGNPIFWVYLLVYLALVLFAGTCTCTCILAIHSRAMYIVHVRMNIYVHVPGSMIVHTLQFTLVVLNELIVVCSKLIPLMW